MNQANYQESIVIPTLQKKLQELQQSNLVLEVSLLIEQAKVKDIESFYKNQIGEVTKLKEELSQKDQRVTSLKTEINISTEERNNLTSRLSEVQHNLNREISIKDSVLNEYRQLKEQFNSLTAEFNTFKQSINTKKVKEPKLV